MKVKSKVDPKEFEQDVTCSNCTAVLSIEITDVRKVSPHFDQREPYNTGSSYYRVICAVCAHHIRVTVPAKFHHLVKEENHGSSFYDR